jgi:hypothetical protein
MQSKPFSSSMLAQLKQSCIVSHNVFSGGQPACRHPDWDVLRELLAKRLGIAEILGL